MKEETQQVIQFSVKMISAKGMTPKEVNTAIRRVGESALGKSKKRRVTIDNPYDCGRTLKFDEGCEYGN